MHIGILQCDSLREDLRVHFGDYPGMFETLLGGIDDALTFSVYDVCAGEYPASTDACEAYLITGSRFGVYDEAPWIAPLADYLRLLHSERRRLVGICFGHQVIAHALGGLAAKSDKGWGVGVHTATLFAQPPWLDPARPDFSLIVSHQDQIVRLPPGAECIAGSEFCPYAALVIEDRVLSFQGHPEFSAELSHALMDLRREVIGGELTTAGMDSLENPVQSLEVGRWMVNFLRRET